MTTTSSQAGGTGGGGGISTATDAASHPSSSQQSPPPLPTSSVTVAGGAGGDGGDGDGNGDDYGYGSSRGGGNPRCCFLLIENDRKSNNLGSLLRCAVGFGISTIVAVGYDKCAVQGSHGASKHVRIVAYPTAEQAVQFLRHDCRCTSIVGLLGCLPNGYDVHDGTKGYPVRIVDAHDILSPPASMHATNTNRSHREEIKLLVQAQLHEDDNDTVDATTTNNEFKNEESLLLCHRSFSVTSRPFTEDDGTTCFVVGWKERGYGLNWDLARFCDTFVHVAHVALTTNQSTASTSDAESQTPPQSPILLLDIPTCLSITLHHYTEWAKYEERDFQGHKFHVDVKQYNGRIEDDDELAELRHQRATQKQQMTDGQNEEQNMEAIQTLFD